MSIQAQYFRAVKEPGVQTSLSSLDTGQVNYSKKVCIPGG